MIAQYTQGGRKGGRRCVDVYIYNNYETRVAYEVYICFHNHMPKSGLCSMLGLSVILVYLSILPCGSIPAQMII